MIRGLGFRDQEVANAPVKKDFVENWVPLL